MSLISGREQRWQQPVTLVLNLRGRSAYSSVSTNIRWIESENEVASKTSSGVTPATGQPLTERGMSPQAPSVMMPQSMNRLRTSGRSCTVSQWNWKFCRVVMSQKPRP